MNSEPMKKPTSALRKKSRPTLSMFCWFYERFIDVISENYFAITYLGSENFWPATKRYYYLSEKYYDQSSTVASDVAQVVGVVIAITAGLIDPAVWIGAGCVFAVVAVQVAWSRGPARPAKVVGIWQMVFGLVVVAGSAAGVIAA